METKKSPCFLRRFLRHAPQRTRPISNAQFCPKTHVRSATITASETVTGFCDQHLSTPPRVSTRVLSVRPRRAATEKLLLLCFAARACQSFRHTPASFSRSVDSLLMNLCWKLLIYSGIHTDAAGKLQWDVPTALLPTRPGCAGLRLPAGHCACAAKLPFQVQARSPLSPENQPWSAVISTRKQLYLTAFQHHCLLR